MTSLIEHILHLSGWLALLIVFAVPALESSVFLGFFFPGETALILGGVLASYGRVSLWAVLVAGICGAVIGDSVGYLVGREYGQRLLQTRPFRRVLKPGRLQRGQDYLARRGGRAVFFGRFTAALRVLVPGLAGMARMPYRIFLPFNVAGGAIWGTGMVLLGYLAGASWKQVAHYATQVGIALFVVVVLALVLGHLLRSAREPDSWAGRQVTRLGHSRPVRWLGRRFPAQLRWLAARFQPGVPTGFAMTVAVLTLGACAWSFGSLTNSVLNHINSARLDPRVLAFVIAHRQPWLTGLARTLTWLGSGFVLWPVVIGSGLALWWWRREWLAAVLPALSLAGAWGWSRLAKALVARPRPPAADWLGTFHGWSYPSEHAAQALGAWGMLGLMVMAGRSFRARTLLMTGAFLIALVVGLSRLYLAAVWMTDVLAGWALAGAWGCLLIIPYLVAERAAATDRPMLRKLHRPGPGAAPAVSCPASRTRGTDRKYPAKPWLTSKFKLASSGGRRLWRPGGGWVRVAGSAGFDGLRGIWSTYIPYWPGCSSGNIWCRSRAAASRTLPAGITAVVPGPGVCSARFTIPVWFIIRSVVIGAALCAGC